MSGTFSRSTVAPSVYELFYSSQTQARPVSLDPEQVYSGEVELTHAITPLVSATVAGVPLAISQ